MPTIEQARTWYTDPDPVHDFDHILRVYRMAERLAKAEGADLEIVRAAALLHDAEGSNPSNQAKRATHQHASAEFAEEVLSAEGWDAQRIAAVQHCIRAHRFRDTTEPPQTLEAQVLFDADKLDAIGAVGIARVIAYSAGVENPFYAPPSDKFLKTGDKEPGELHTSYHEHLYKLGKIKDRIYTPTGKAIANNRHCYLDEFFKRLIAEWNGEL
ncbi:MAG: HD domain-containing protein [Chloroflexota bacterium]